MSHELFLTKRRKTKINAFANNLSTDIKHGRAQLTKIIISGRFLSTVLGKLAGALMKVCVPLLTFLTPLATMLSASALHGAIQRKMCGRGIAKAGKRTTLVTLN